MSPKLGEWVALVVIWLLIELIVFLIVEAGKIYEIVLWSGVFVTLVITLIILNRKKRKPL